MSEKSSPWLFSRNVDVGVFGGSALLSIAFLVVGALTGSLSGETPEWAWVPTVLLVDVAHVWATGFRVYFDPRELRRRPLLYLFVPLASYIALFQLYRLGTATFWRGLAYLAIFHFVRQQAGWVALYRAREGRGKSWNLDKAIDMAAVYAATVYPLIFWHTHARKFDWFAHGDVFTLPLWLDTVARPLYGVALGAYAVRGAYNFWAHRRITPGKDLVVGTTALCWYLGIIHFNSDYAFTVTNVFIHGIPYMALISRTRRQSESRASSSGVMAVGRSLVPLLGTLWALAYVEELVWNRGVWGEHDWLFGPAWDASAWGRWLVPILALPQVTHYVLDGFIWKRKTNPSLVPLLSTQIALPTRSFSQAIETR